MSVTMVHSHVLPTGGGGQLGVLVKRSYRIEPGKRATPCDHVPALFEAPKYALPDDEGPLLHDADVLAFAKALTDVLVVGHAHATRGPTAALEASVRVGRAQKTARVVGDRKIVAQGAGLGTSAPLPFQSMPLSWERAYGGRDVHAEERLAKSASEELVGTFSYPRNAFGKGFFADLDRGRVVGTSMPNFEDPADPVTVDRLFATDALDWIDRPIAAGFGPIDVFTFPRCMFFQVRPDWAPPTRAVRELALGGLLQQDLADRPMSAPPDTRLYNAAPAGLAVTRLQGGERVSLWNLHPAHELFEFDLPGEPPRIVVEPPNAGVRDLVPTLQTVLIEPDQDRVTLTWTGSIPVAGIFPPEMCRDMRHAAIWPT